MSLSVIGLVLLAMTKCVVKTLLWTLCTGLV